MSPRIVTENLTFTWDHAAQRLARGTLIDVPAGSALEAAIGVHRLRPLRNTAPAPAPAPAPVPVPAPAPETAPAKPQPAPKSRAAAKTAAAPDGGEGG